MSKKKVNIKGVAEKVGHGMTDGVKVAIAVVAALATAEVSFLGASMLENDAELVKDCVKHKIDPEPVFVKKGLLGKKQVKTINPFNGKIENYNGNKMPSSKAVIKIK